MAAITGLVVPGNQRHFGAKVATRILSFYCRNFCRRSNQKKCYKHVALEFYFACIFMIMCKTDRTISFTSQWKSQFAMNVNTNVNNIIYRRHFREVIAVASLLSVFTTWTPILSWYCTICYIGPVFMAIGIPRSCQRCSLPKDYLVWSDISFLKVQLRGKSLIIIDHGLFRIIEDPGEYAW